MIKLKLTQLVFFLSLSLCANGQFQVTELSNPEAYGMSGDSLENMNKYFHGLVDQGQLAGIQTAVMSKGKLVHFDSYGMADIENNMPLNDKSIFRVFSMTKPIVSVALMQLYEQGIFKLDDPLYDHLPAFKESFLLVDSTLVPTQNSIRIIDLLRHSSGYNYGRHNNLHLVEYYNEANLNASIDNKEFAIKLSQIPLQFEPGTDWQYGHSTTLCGYLIEVLSGQSLNDYLQDSIFTPLQMMDTHFQLPQEKVDRFTTGYRWDEEDGLFISEPRDTNRYLNDITLFNGGGGLVSTTFDYLRFCQMLLKKGSLDDIRILKEGTIKIMFDDHLETVRPHQEERLRLPMGEASFGLGFAIRGEDVNSLERVYGWGGAVGTYFKIDLENDLCYIMMIQLSPYRHLGLRRILQDFIASSIN